MQKEKIDLIFEKYKQFCENFPASVVEKTLNGAGPAGHGTWVRDTLFYKYCVTDAANIHDFLYSEFGPNNVSRQEADDFFLFYMLVKLEQQKEASKVFNKPLIYLYYSAVRMFGWSFWTKTKNN